MPTVEFTPNLSRQTKADACIVEGATVAEALNAVFVSTPALRGYILDEQGEVRTHVVIFVDGRAIKDRHHLSDTLKPDSEIFVMQALSGG
jgi:molybdopterin converting factor small subunit